MGSVMEVARATPSAGTLVERTSPLRIAHVGDSMEMGGAEKLTATLCRLQRDRGHIASVHCLYGLVCSAKSCRPKVLRLFSTTPGSFFHLMRVFVPSLQALSAPMWCIATMQLRLSTPLFQPGSPA